MAALYIIYNAKASIGGKLHYAYRKLSAPAGSSPCAACDLTHGGLRLAETEEWTQTKARIGATVKQLHLDELSDEVKQFLTDQKLQPPIILGQSEAGAELKVIMTQDELQSCKSDHQKFLQDLSTKSRDNGLDIPISTTASKI